MQTATWLTSRELTAAAGAWDKRLMSDDNGEHFSRVIVHCDAIKFAPDAKVYYREKTLRWTAAKNARGNYNYWKASIVAGLG